MGGQPSCRRLGGSFRVRLSLLVSLVFSGLPIAQGGLLLDDVCQGMRAHLSQIQDVEFRYDIAFGRGVRGEDGSLTFEPGMRLAGTDGAEEWTEGQYGDYGSVWREKGDKLFLDRTRRTPVRQGGSAWTTMEAITQFSWDGLEGRSYGAASRSGRILAEPNANLRQTAFLPWLFNYHNRMKPDHMMLLPEYFETYGDEVGSETQSIGNRECVVVVVDRGKIESRFSGIKERFWLDVGRGFSMLRYELVDARGNVVTAVSEIALEEVAPNVWYPVRGVACGDDGLGKAYQAYDVRVNQGLPDSDFRIQFPPGTHVHDKRAGLKYRMPVAGDMQSEEIDDELLQNVSSARVELGVDARPDEGAPALEAQSTSPDDSREPRRALLPTGWGLLAAAIAAAIVVIIIWGTVKRARTQH